MRNEFSNARSTVKAGTLSCYRADIEGLRAVAILLVIAAHAGVPWLKGGYIGVDVFFVLSGYLITRLIVQEFQKTGQVRLLEFYSRRIRRLFPALLIMLIIVSIMAAVSLSPYEQVRQAFYSKFALLGLSNIQLAFSNFNYFDHIEKESLFLHTWSLGVEEQFYLVWPILMIIILRKFHSVKGDTNLHSILVVMLLIFTVGLIISIFLTSIKPLWGFYLMPSRAWQFALGSSTLFLTMINHRKEKSIFANDVIGGWLGIVVIVFSATLFDQKTEYPSFYAIFPSIGTALVIFCGSTKRNSISSFLSLKPCSGSAEFPIHGICGTGLYWH